MTSLQRRFHVVIMPCACWELCTHCPSLAYQRLSPWTLAQKYEFGYPSISYQVYMHVDIGAADILSHIGQKRPLTYSPVMAKSARKICTCHLSLESREPALFKSFYRSKIGFVPTTMKAGEKGIRDRPVNI